MFKKSIIHGYCAFCKSERTYFRRKHVSFSTIVYAIVFGGLVSQAVWQAFDPRALIVSAVIVCISEIATQLRWRLSLVCSECGFDPLVYKRNPTHAAERVRKHLEERQADPMSIFRPQLPILRDRKPPIVSRELAVKEAPGPPDAL